MELVIGIILIVAALFLIIAVLMQHGKDHNLSGTIAGASESFFGKSKSTTLDRKLSVLTSVVAVVFVILVLVMYLGQGGGDASPAETAPATTESAEVPADTADAATGTETAGEPTDTAEPTESGTESAEATDTGN
ncbi:MAG: preprotein translocase subunit SecG [Clostridia bacterium]|nr:preprotein translocase subunit SecG [Clostridia bacterium]